MIVTHDMDIARHAERIIELKDGRVIADRPHARSHRPFPGDPGRHQDVRQGQIPLMAGLGNALRMALRAMVAQRPAPFSPCSASS